ncbi:MAG: outer membrane lipoprotein-sorting protein [Bryobacterales bacterium]|nr:outer membrane lipoprotein-sorting protein [Bryobacteraceae bacterium]MDW8353851.1 outer membrane lipoprotein-sorting protein [Bryobacterales bacterium]
MNRLCAWLLLAASVGAAQEARSIVEEAQRRTRTQSQRYEGTLEVIGSKGKIAVKRWRYERLGSHGSSKAVLRFTAPPEVKGVALLVHNHPDRASDQWMWTPALQRDRRIALQDRSTRFFGTDFSFEDLEERDVDQFDYRLAGEETVDGALSWKIEAEPKKTRASQYTRSLIWIRKDNYAWVQMEGYRGGRLIRRVRYLDLELVQGIWTARRLEVTDFTRNSRTVLRVDKLEYNVKLSPEEFTLQALRRES